ncbi:hypothetical protein [Mucilaginibacter rubeus]|uniref:hypothetical protein n=1 Tax=Mucilaginibacter rubeus TaxID=2027860 RepID=UPI001668AFE8|nr:hypothetical protein [Mucilaginibacter rubeus]GGA94854.1 hypothetical protein GCM10011500_08260 [Mucilaginibacter rubeus]
MKPIDFFKLQSKNLFKDYKTQRPATEADPSYFGYDPKYFDINGLFLDYDIDEENFSLMNAQHLIAKLVGFRKWTDLVKASATELELAKMLFDNQHKLSAEDWQMYVRGVESENNTTLSPEFKLEILVQVFVNVDGHESTFQDYRLKPSQPSEIKSEITNRIIAKTGKKITSLPLKGKNRDGFVETAKSVFETVIWRMEPQHPEIVRKLWNPESYIDNVLLKDDMLPIDRDYALSLIDAFLVHHVLELAIQADELAIKLN